MAILITRPNHDLACNYLYYWSNEVVNLAKSKSIDVIDLPGNKATRRNLESYIKKHKPRLIFFNGHGSSNEIAGDSDKVLVKVGDNEKVLRNTIVYARSCETIIGLAQKSVKGGATAFIGYNRKFLLGYSKNKITKPMQDGVAKLFLKPSNLVPISLLKGNSVKESYQKSQDAMKRNLFYMLSSIATPEEKDAIPYLLMNRRSQTFKGDGDARV